MGGFSDNFNIDKSLKESPDPPGCVNIKLSFPGLADRLQKMNSDTGAFVSFRKKGDVMEPDLLSSEFVSLNFEINDNLRITVS